MFGRRSIFLLHFQVHGLFVASMFGGILGSEFPGSIYMLQNLLFKAPCYVGSSVTARLEVLALLYGRVLFNVFPPKKCFPGFEHQCGQAGCDMALHCHRTFSVTDLSMTSTRALQFFICLLQSSDGTLLIDGEARMKAPPSLELTLPQ